MRLGRRIEGFEFFFFVGDRAGRPVWARLLHCSVRGLAVGLGGVEHSYGFDELLDIPILSINYDKYLREDDVD